MKNERSRVTSPLHQHLRKESHMSHAPQSPPAEVAPGIHRLTGGVANFYLVEQPGGLTLVDAGTPGDWQLFLRTLDTLGRRPDDLDAVVVTPAHPDHTGMAEQARTTANTKVWVHASDTGAATTGKAGAMERKFASYMLRPEFYRTMWILVRAGSTKIIPVREVSTFADDEVLDVPGKPRAVHIPATRQAAPRCSSNPGESCSPATAWSPAIR